MDSERRIAGQVTFIISLLSPFMTISAPLAGYILTCDDLRKKEVVQKMFPGKKIEPAVVVANVRAHLMLTYQCEMPDILRDGNHYFVLVPPGTNHDLDKPSAANKTFGEKMKKELGLPVKWVHLPKPDIRCVEARVL
ncbi:hypothetical protein FRC09_020322 [Ceratobasidium sp. 395]|nr:hypothetical protein FRC09_020322 [Ceratobasidium sp. 395]